MIEMIAAELMGIGVPPILALYLATKFAAGEAVDFADLTGDIAISQMAGGIGAGPSTYWRGDGSWAALPPTAFSALTGNIAVSQMAAGAGASPSTFWRGDGSWSALPLINFSDLLGNIAVGQMAGGVGAAATTFWAGDGAWKQPDSANIDFLGTGTGAVVRPMREKARDHFHLRDYGTPTGGDNSALINTAIAAVNVAGGGYLTMPPGTVPASAITLLGGVTLVGAGKGTASKIQNIGSASYLITAAGSYGTPIALTVDAAMGATQITVSSTAGLAAGDAIVIYDNYSYNPVDAAYKSGETAFIKTVDSGVLLTLESKLYGSMFAGNSYAVANAASIKKANFVESPCIADIELYSTLASATQATNFNIVRGLLLEDVHFRDWGNVGQRLDGVVRAKILNGSCDNFIDGGVGTAGYASFLTGPCFDVLIQGNQWNRLRHGFTTGANASGYPHFITVQGNTTFDTHAAGLDTHNSGDGIEFLSNVVSMTGTFGVNIRSKNTTLKGGKISGTNNQGISLDETGLSGVTIDDVDVENTGSHGLSCNESCPDLKIIDTRFKNIGIDGMNLFATTDAASPGLIVDGNSVEGYGILSANRYGLLTSGSVTSTGALIKNNHFDPLTGSAAYAIRTNALTGSAVIRNTASGTFTVSPWNLSTNVDIANTKIDAADAETILTKASTTARASLNIPHGAAPTAPVNGDMWTTTAGAFVQINGVTKTFTLT